jgi:hypothetical protein
MTNKKKRKKPQGQLVDCPCCLGTGVQRIYTFKEMQDLFKWKDGEVRANFVLNGKKYKIYLHVDEVREIREM